MSTLLIDRVCELVATGEMSRAGLARAAGLHPNSLRNVGEPDWNPTADTLLKLEKFLSAGNRDVMATAERAGARIVKPAGPTFYGGYAGYFQDPDGHLWEVVWNPAWTPE